MDQAKLNELLQYLLDAVKFGKEQLPQVAEEAIRYYRIIDTFETVLFLALLTFCLWLAFRLVRKRKDEDWDDNPVRILGTIIASIGIVAFTIVSVVCFESAIKVWTSPRLYLLEYFMKLAKGGSE